jgi:hypothetical protein
MPRKRLDRRALRALQELAQAQTIRTDHDTDLTYELGFTLGYWAGVAGAIEHLIGEPQFEVIEHKTVTKELRRVLQTNKL